MKENLFILFLTHFGWCRISSWFMYLKWLLILSSIHSLLNSITLSPSHTPSSLKIYANRYYHLISCLWVLFIQYYLLLKRCRQITGTHLNKKLLCFHSNLNLKLKIRVNFWATHLNAPKLSMIQNHQYLLKSFPGICFNGKRVIRYFVTVI